MLNRDAKGRGFDAALGFDFMHFLMSILGWGRVVVINKIISAEPNSNMEIFSAETNTNVPVASNIKLKI